MFLCLIAARSFLSVKAKVLDNTLTIHWQNELISGMLRILKSSVPLVKNCMTMTLGRFSMSQSSKQKSQT